LNKKIQNKHSNIFFRKKLTKTDKMLENLIPIKNDYYYFGANILKAFIRITLFDIFFSKKTFILFIYKK
jgi:hypothetical protein